MLWRSTGGQQQVNSTNPFDCSTLAKPVRWHILLPTPTEKRRLLLNRGGGRDGDLPFQSGICTIRPV